MFYTLEPHIMNDIRFLLDVVRRAARLTHYFWSSWWSSWSS